MAKSLSTQALDTLVSVLTVDNELYLRGKLLQGLYVLTYYLNGAVRKDIIKVINTRNLIIQVLTIIRDALFIDKLDGLWLVIGSALTRLYRRVLTSKEYMDYRIKGCLPPRVMTDPSLAIWWHIHAVLTWESGETFIADLEDAAIDTLYDILMIEIGVFKVRPLAEIIEEL